MKFNNKELDNKFKINDDFYNKDLIKFVDWYLEKITESCKSEQERQATRALKPFMLNYSSCLLVFILSINGDFSRMNEMKILTPKEAKIKPISEEKL